MSSFLSASRSILAKIKSWP